MDKIMTRIREFLLGTWAELQNVPGPTGANCLNRRCLVIVTIALLTGYILWWTWSFVN